MSLQEAAEESVITGFDDYDSISDWAREYMEKAVSAGLIYGMEDTPYVRRTSFCVNRQW